MFVIIKQEYKDGKIIETVIVEENAFLKFETPEEANGYIADVELNLFDGSIIHYVREISNSQ